MLKKAPFAAIALAFCLASCGGMAQRQEDDYRVDSIILTNIPAVVNGQPAYKVYVFVTDSTSQNDPNTAQGTAELNGAASVTVPLYAPPQNWKGADPDDHGEPWLGTGKYFSVIISPRNAPGKDAILVRAGQAINKPNQRCDFRELMQLSGSTLFAGKVGAIYDNVIRCDNQGIGSDVVTPAAHTGGS